MRKTIMPYATSGAVAGAFGGPAGSFAGFMTGMGVQAFDWIARTYSDISVRLNNWARDIQTWNPYY